MALNKYVARFKHREVNLLGFVYESIVDYLEFTDQLSKQGYNQLWERYNAMEKENRVEFAGEILGSNSIEPFTNLFERYVNEIEERWSYKLVVITAEIYRSSAEVAWDDPTQWIWDDKDPFIRGKVNKAIIAREEVVDQLDDLCLAYNRKDFDYPSKVLEGEK